MGDTHCLRGDGGNGTEQGDWKSGSKMMGRNPRDSGISGARKSHNT